MGQDVTGLSPSSVTPQLNGSSHDTIHGIYSKSSTESSVPKAALAAEGSIEVAPDEIYNAQHDVLGVKSPKLENSKNDVQSSKVEEIKSRSPDKSGLEMTPVENVETKRVVQNSFNATDQHACAKSPSVNNLQSSSSSKKSQSNSSCVSRKHLDNEDNWSTASSTTASVRAARTRTTMPVAPKFTVTERLEKRKEFYSKLEEKHKALEAEKHEYEARNKEEQQAAIKQLRKSMVYKANPVPNFYYEGPPPKKEIKKAPTTRAVSPKFGRRKSCGDAASSSSAEKVVSGRTTNRYSLGCKGSVTPTNTLKKKSVVQEPSSKGGLKKERPKQLPKESTPAKEPAPDTAPPLEPEPERELEPAQETSPAPAVAEDINEQKMENLSVQS